MSDETAPGRLSVAGYKPGEMHRADITDRLRQTVQMPSSPGARVGSEDGQGERGVLQALRVSATSFNKVLLRFLPLGAIKQR